MGAFLDFLRVLFANDAGEADSVTIDVDDDDDEEDDELDDELRL
jgi:hypothetical protein